MFFNPATLTPPATFATLRLSANCEPVIAPAEIRKVAELADPLAAGKVAEVAEVAEGIAAKNDSGATAKVAESQKSQTLAAEKNVARRLWLIANPIGERFSVSCNPPRSQIEIERDYPGCTVSPEPDSQTAPPLSADDLAIAEALLNHWQETDADIRRDWLEGLRDPARLEGMRQMALAAGVARYEAAPEPATDPDPSPQAVCARCRHWQADRINPSGGLGRCTTDAPASRKPGSCWPWADAFIHCNQFEVSLC